MIAYRRSQLTSWKCQRWNRETYCSVSNKLLSVFIIYLHLHLHQQRSHRKKLVVLSDKLTQSDLPFSVSLWREYEIFYCFFCCCCSVDPTKEAVKCFIEIGHLGFRLRRLYLSWNVFTETYKLLIHKRHKTINIHRAPWKAEHLKYFYDFEGNF